ncbi:MAG: replication-associated recombination protein A [Candidatus Roizmanbacteria bacterium]
MATPLAFILRPKTLTDYVGQSHLVGPGKPITHMIASGELHSILLWGPPGCGKTTLAALIAQAVDAVFVPISAVESGTSDIKAIIQSAKRRRIDAPRPLWRGFTGIIPDKRGSEIRDPDISESPHTILFIDEIHRFNKLQQDALLGAVEQGILTLIGATTENPGFSVIPALVSRCQTYRLHAHNESDMKTLIVKACKHLELKAPGRDVIDFLCSYGSGDARKILNAIDIAASGQKSLSVQHLTTSLQSKTARYDKAGDDHYDTISAFIKSMRGSNPDASLHYLARMIEAGEEPVFIARRMTIFASEDIGNAQPTALVVATACMQAVALIGMPEAKIILAQCATYLATAKKSTASYDGIEAALADVKGLPWDSIPLHLRNAVNSVVKAEGYGKDHVRYPWKAERDGQTVDQEYLPENLKGKKYYKV